MPYGYWGRIARIDLTSGSIRYEEPGWQFYRRYLGGRNIALHYLLQELAPGTDPFGPENKLVIATSVITGTDFPGSSRFTVAAKSPLTGGYGESEAGGWFGPELKKAGFDALIIEGKAPRPVYIWVHDGHIEIRDADHLWGKSIGDGWEMLRKEIGDPLVRVLQIGPAGERRVRFACIASDLRNFCGRSGLGAVMGAKNLRAIAARGTYKVPVYDKDALKELILWFGRNFRKNPGIVEKQKLGTALNVLPLNEMGLLPTRNFREGSFEGAESISGEALRERFLLRGEGCRACPVACKRVVRGPGIDGRYGGPEYESIGSLGSNCGVADLAAVCKANEVCNRYGLDTISTGVAIAFAMECFEKGLLTKEETEDLELRFGNAEALIAMCEKIALRQGIGDLLAEGSWRAAQTIGKGAERLTMTVKGQEMPAHEPRGKWGVGLGYAVSPTGADHLQAAHDTWFDRPPNLEEEYTYIDVSDLWPFGVYQPVSAETLGPDKVRMFTFLQRWWSLHNVLDLCIFVSAPEYRMTNLCHLAHLVRASTGWNVNVWELLRAGELGITMARAFNVREGFGSKDDRLPQRFFESMTYLGGKRAGISREEFERAVSLYYALMGWDREGIPQEWKLVDLGVPWIAELLRSKQCE